MENQEFNFKGLVLNGFLMLFVDFAMLILSIVGIIYSIIMLDASDGAQGGWLLGGSILLLVINIIMWCGMLQLEQKLDDDKKAAMVSNLLVVLCGDESAQPVVNTGTLNH